MSWAHYQYGLKHIARERLREQLDHAQAMRMANMAVDDWDVWQRDMITLTEVPRDG